jgi:N-acetylglucosaminyldiphosphoundecaprenol N-acetyl-beta-D-mannosaminyltransferase
MIARSQAVPARRTLDRLVSSPANVRNGSLEAGSSASARPSRTGAAQSSSAVSFLTPPITRPPVSLLGVPFDHVTAPDCLQWFDNAIASRRPHYVVTANVDFLVQARFDVELRRILLDAHLVLCDGTPLLWASRLLGNALPERVAGADVVPALIQVAARKGYRIFFLGATPDACQRAVESLGGLYPDLKVAGHYSPPFNKLLEMDHDEIARRVREAKPDLLFVCFGCPKQEKWMTMHYRSLGVPVSIGLGATIDFLAGQVKRAPLWMRQSGLEWTFRLAQEPRRLFWRYFKDLWVFGWAITSQWSNFQLRRKPRNHAPQFRPLRGSAAWQRYKLPASVDCDTVGQNLSELDAILNDSRHCLFDVSEVKFIDSTGLGMIARLQQKLSNTGRQLILLSPTAATRRALRVVRLREFITCACDVPTALQIIDSRAREATAAATRRTAAASNPLAWHGEITAANAEAVWKFTRDHIHLLCSGWKPSGANGNHNGIGSPGAGRVSSGAVASDGNAAFANGHSSTETNGNPARAGDTSLLARANAEPHPVLDALKLRILNPPTLVSRKVTIDLSNVRFIDSTGLGLMVRARKLAGGYGAQLRFTGLQPAVRNVVRIAKMEDYLLSADPPR